ncbi:MAG: hypothetical protein WCL32_18790 [Planctomycetota bacterium]
MALINAVAAKKKPVKVRKLHKPYPKPCCPNCGVIFKPGQLRTGENRCAACNGTFQAAIFQPPPETMAVRTLNGAGAAAVSVSITLESGESAAVASAADSPCARHELNAAEGICDRCGTFICSLCRIEMGGKGYCPTCLERVLQSGSDDFGPERAPFHLGVAAAYATVGFVGPFLGLIFGPMAIARSIEGIKDIRARRDEHASMTGFVVVILVAIVETLGYAGLAIWLGMTAFKKL